MRMKQIIWEDESLGTTYSVSDIPDEMVNEASTYREKLLETVAEFDDDIMESYLAEIPITEEQLLDAIRKATITLKLVPVFCGAALRNKGIQFLLDGIVDFLPSPLDAPPVKGRDPETQQEVAFPFAEKGPLVALVFKVMMDQGRKLSYARIYSGRLKAGAQVSNPAKQVQEKISRILAMHANKRQRIDEASAGNIVGIVGLKVSETGDTLCSGDTQVVLERIEAYEPVISVAVEPKTHSDQEKIGLALAKLEMEDPTFHVKNDEDTGQTIISGMGELHLEILVSRLEREFHTQVNVGRPQVVYKEAIDVPAEAESTFDKEVSGVRQFGQVRLHLAPRKRGEGNAFFNQLSEEVLPAEFVPPIQEGVLESLESGVLLGYPVLDVKVSLAGAAMKETGSSLAFKVAASMATKEGLRNGKPFLLEPIMAVEILVPEPFMGEVLGEINARGGKIGDIKPRGGLQVIGATVPLSKMFGYSTALRSATQGRGTFSMHFSHYDKAVDPPV
jgi:elongation factor G